MRKSDEPRAELRCVAPAKFEITFTGSEDELVRLAEALNEEPLDSPDVGDAMGVFMFLLALNGELDEVGDQGGLLHGEMHVELFRWTGLEKK